MGASGESRASKPGKPGKPGKLGLIAGAGRLPHEAARRLRERGVALEVFAFEGIGEAPSDPSMVFRLGELERLLEAFASRGVMRLLVLGRFDSTLAGGGTRPLEPDATALSLLRTLSTATDDVARMGLVADWFEARGLSLCRQDILLSEFLAPVGPLTARIPDAEQLADLVAGRAAVASLGRQVGGQAVVVLRGGVVAREEAAGTDAMIRGVVGGAGRGATVVKGARPEQDRRLDLPAIGPGTIASMVEVGARGLAVEAGVTLLAERDRLRADADAAEIAVWGFDSGAGAA